MTHPVSFSLEQLQQAATALTNELETKVLDLQMTPAPEQKFRAAEVDFDHVFFMQGEILLFGGVNTSTVIQTLNQTGIPRAAYDIITDGFPLYFCDSNNVPDTQPPPGEYYLQHSDLPYGFVGTPEEPGVFQFSSPEVANLTLATKPIPAGNIAVYIGKVTDESQVPSYEQLTGPESFKYQLTASPFNWIPGRTQAESLSNLNNNRVPYYAFMDGGSTGSVIRENYVEYNSAKDAIEHDDWWEPFRTGVTMGNYWDWDTSEDYSPYKIVGWRISPPLGRGGNDTPINLLVQPSGQLSSFQVNPSTQKPYRGAEGVYPVIMVEMLVDVNIVL